MDLKDFKDLAPTRQAASVLDGFKAFAFKGNVIDLAVGVIIGGAFGNIVKSLVDNLLMPVVGIVLPGKRGYEGWVLTIRGATIPYGKFLGDVVNFLILAFVLYLFIVRFVGWMMAAREQEATKIPPLTKDQELLAEIRDTLRQQSRSHPEG
ncbi:large conductance mechanosensitive channel protein MscL [Tundrisphaera lichenicola]|uniref:large conductance mechanosensitive channel protein MscL n=1 Tax=Tundrisphaera lichenicola TaxID=2029860 RepID=UPI003EBF8797